jgi:hypothetical protein
MAGRWAKYALSQPLPDKLFAVGAAGGTAVGFSCAITDHPGEPLRAAAWAPLYMFGGALFGGIAFPIALVTLPITGTAYILNAAYCPARRNDVNYNCEEDFPI